MGRGLGRPPLRLGLMADSCVEDVGDASVGDVDDSERPVGEIGGVLLAIGETSSVWKSASWPCWSDVT